LSSCGREPEHEPDGDIVWIKNFGGTELDYFNDVIQTADGEYVVVGYGNSRNGDFEESDGFAIAKLDENGNMVWRSRCSAYARIETVLPVEGGYFIAGSHGVADDMLIAKFDEDGNAVWEKRYGGSESDVFLDAIQTAEGEYVAVGMADSSDGDIPENNGGADFLIAKFDRNGDQAWIKTYGGDRDEILRAVVCAADGGYVAVGDSNVYFNGDTPGDSKLVISKFSEDGDEEWTKTVKHTSFGVLRDVVGTSDGYVAAGSASKDGETSDFVILKCGVDGELFWLKNYGGSGNEGFHSLAEVGGGFVAAGSSASSDGDLPGNFGDVDFVMAKFDFEGNKLWFKNFGGAKEDILNSVAQIGENAFVAVGHSFSSDGDLPGINGNPENNYNCDAVIIKFDFSGAQ
jgi:hypothetical protein